MKKYLFYTYCLLFASCTAQVEKQNAGADTSFAMATTALEAQSFTDLPYPFRLSYCSLDDTANALSASTDLPYSLDPSHDKLNAAISSLLNREIDGYRTERTRSLLTEKFDHTSFEGWLTHLARRQQVASMCFLTQSYTEGAAHFNHYYLTLNYDLKNERSLLFTDIFNVSSEKEKQEFCYAIYGNDNYEFIMDGLVPADLNSDTKFYFRDDVIVFCFSDYDKGPSLMEIEAPLDSVRRFVKNVIL
jgi:hypothetical protein